jgi:hypothetical protein
VSSLEGEEVQIRSVNREYPHSITGKLAIKPGPRPGGGPVFFPGKVTGQRDAMTDDAESGRSHGNQDRLNTVTDAVHAATAEVSEVERHFSDAIEKGKRSKTFVEVLKDATRAAPIAMLVTAFIAGVMFASGRRRR